jgi:hypothetical protein
MIDLATHLFDTDRRHGGAAGKVKFAGPLGLEIYSLRRELAKDVPGTLARVRRFGFKEVEVPGRPCSQPAWAGMTGRSRISTAMAAWIF